VLSLHGANRTCHIAVTGMHDARQGGLARAACERDAQLRCRRDVEDRGPVDVRIARDGRRVRPGKADKGRELGVGNYRPRQRRGKTPASNGPKAVPKSAQGCGPDRDPFAALDAALAAFAGVIGDQG
jgi:hypothetical protein